MSTYDDLAAPPSTIVTRGELEQRLRERSRPTIERRLEPDTAEASELRHDAALSHERRIDHLRGRLLDARTKSLSDHTFARLQGHARSDFDQSR